MNLWNSYDMAAAGQRLIWPPRRELDGSFRCHSIFYFNSSTPRRPWVWQKLCSIKAKTKTSRRPLLLLFNATWIFFKMGSKIKPIPRFYSDKLFKIFVSKSKVHSSQKVGVCNLQRKKNWIFCHFHYISEFPGV